MTLTEEIIHVLKKHDTFGLNAAEIAEKINADVNEVRRQIRSLLKKSKIYSSTPNSSNTKYLIQSFASQIAKPTQINKMAGVYRPERDNPTSPRRPGHDQHENCGSRMGNTIFFRDGRIQKV